MFKKSQFEVLGIAMVVLLLLLGMLFVVYFASRPKPPVRQVEESILAGRWITSLLETTDPFCYDNTVKELLQTCVERQPSPPFCPGIPELNFPSLSYCDHFNAVLGMTLNKTFTTWEREFKLTIDGPWREAHIVTTVAGKQGKIFTNEEEIEKICLGERETKIHVVPLRIPGATVTIRLDICR